METVLGCRIYRMKDNSEVDLPQAGVRHAVKATIGRSLLSIASFSIRGFNRPSILTPQFPF